MYPSLTVMKTSMKASRGKAKRTVRFEARKDPHMELFKVAGVIFKCVKNILLL
jgi:hypothetical protein